MQWTVTFWPFIGLGPVPDLRICFSKPILLFSSHYLVSWSWRLSLGGGVCLASCDWSPPLVGGLVMDSAWPVGRHLSSAVRWTFLQATKLLLIFYYLLHVVLDQIFLTLTTNYKRHTYRIWDNNISYNECKNIYLILSKWWLLIKDTHVWFRLKLIRYIKREGSKTTLLIKNTLQREH